MNVRWSSGKNRTKTGQATILTGSAFDSPDRPNSGVTTVHGVLGSFHALINQSGTSSSRFIADRPPRSQSSSLHLTSYRPNTSEDQGNRHIHIYTNHIPYTKFRDALPPHPHLLLRIQVPPPSPFSLRSSTVQSVVRDIVMTLRW